MSPSVDASAGQARVSLAETLNLSAAAPLAGEILALRGQDVDLDASGVRRIGGQCAQVLASALATWEADGRSLSIVDPSSELLDGLALMGCADLVGANPVQD